jgi:predicted deacylase
LSQSPSLGTPLGTPFLGVDRRPGQVIKQRVPIAQFSDGSPVLIPVATITGRKDGPTFLVIGGVHGDEVTGIEIARRVIQDVRAEDLAGTLVVVPVCAVPAYLSRGRGWNLEERLEMNGFSRLYPGQKAGLMSERIAYAVLHDFIDHSDATIDLHSALDGCNIVPFTYVMSDRGDGAYEQQKRIAFDFGTPFVYRVDLGEASTVDRSTLPLGMPQMRHPGRLGEPTTSAPASDLKGKVRVTAEMGESKRISWEYVALGLRGVRRSMQSMGMLAGKLEPTEAPREFSHIANVHVNAGGGLHLSVNEGDDVTLGQPIGWIEDVFGDRAEELVAPVGGFIQRKMKFGSVATGAEAVWIGYSAEKGAGRKTAR